MPYIFQEEVLKAHPHQTGCETFDSMYRLYEIFKNLSCFLVNLYFGPQEKLKLSDILSFLQSASQKYQVSHWVVRCKQNTENHPIEAVAFADILDSDNLQKCAQYIHERLSQGYDCVVHEVIVGQYPSNRLDWLYSFGICYKNALPQIEIYPATDAGSIKWGKLSPLDLITVDPQFNPVHTSIRKAETLNIYQHAKLQEWAQQFKKELKATYPNKNVFCNILSLQKLLREAKHPLFDTRQVDEAIQKTQKDLTDIALKYSFYAQENNLNPDHTILHGSLLFNYRMIIWDITTDKRWQHIKHQ